MDPPGCLRRCERTRPARASSDFTYRRLHTREPGRGEKTCSRNESLRLTGYNARGSEQEVIVTINVGRAMCD